MDQPPIVFVNGLPRTGSTLLMNLLGQNPRHHVTATNALLDLIVSVRDIWRDLIEFKSQGIEAVQPRIISLMKGMLLGFYENEFKAGKVVFDKCRGWLAYIELMEEVLDRPITVLVTVRDIRAIVASFEKLFQQNPVTSPRFPNYCAGQTIEGRAAQLLGESGTIGLPLNRLRDALRRRHKSNILLIPYNQLCRNTQAIMDRIHEELELEAFQYDPTHVKQITYEDDTLHGLPLHKVRPKVELPDETPWEGVLPESLCKRLCEEFADIQKYASPESQERF
jgi:sulfotransferase